MKWGGQRLVTSFWTTGRVCTGRKGSTGIGAKRRNFMRYIREERLHFRAQRGRNGGNYGAGDAPVKELQVHIQRGIVGDWLRNDVVPVLNVC